jgi:hypothetical protein
MRVFGLSLAGAARTDGANSGPCCTSGIEYGTSGGGDKRRDRPSMGRLRSGLASRLRPLEPVARGMGSAALRAQPQWWGLARPLRWADRSL